MLYMVEILFKPYGESTKFMPKQIDDNFFKKYGPELKNYDDIYQHYTRVDEAIILFNDENAPRLRKICVFGAATGRVQEDFFAAFNLISYGCEINKWAHSQIPNKFRTRTKLMDMRDYLKWCIKRKLIFDMGYSNSFQYLSKNEIPSFFKKLSCVCRFVHFHGSFRGDSAKDPYRTTFESYAWWNKQFTSNGFKELTDTWGGKTYLWKSKELV